MYYTLYDISCEYLHLHLADAFIQSDLQCIQAKHLYCEYVNIMLNLTYSMFYMIYNVNIMLNMYLL